METRESEWGSLIPELVGLVLQKVQEGAENRGEGRRVVAIAGVCRAWRRSVHQELHHQPPSLLTFPASTQQPAPSASHLQCLLKKTGNTFRLVQVVSGDEYFLLGARKKFTIGSSYFRISTDPRVLWTQGHDDVVSVTSNFWRTAFHLQDNSCSKSATTNSKTTLSLKYEEVAVDGNCLRRMRCKKSGLEGRNANGEGGWWPSWLTSMPSWNHLLNFNPVKHSHKLLKNRAASSSLRSPDTVKSSRNSSLDDRVFSLRNKDPDWQEQKQCWSLDFKGRGKIVPSIHNFQLVSSDESGDGRIILQLGKLCKGLYILDFGAPLSALEAFAICLSSFVTSVGLDI
ncbi:hypothetical protein KC19_1G146900 [Ceratodon purpureus]|uniref:Tubby C-terminal domain-containing protein n=1 Tax=Ceratodon purpureus TaxID=3225 RepID=A0A8T0J573_CERPU|nr:hypothetical protein KC19_1G146900 [Ceratodon purpureus]